ncbi:MAG: aminotransferase class IV [Deltaproteobacteria bacterium]|nr:aminotransferase class IV [Deltaproteobacteria bacterium]
MSIDGRIVPPHEAVIPVFDRGFLYGDSVYEVLRAYGCIPFALEEHLARLGRSAGLLGIDLPLAPARLSEEIEQLLSRADNGDSYIRVIVTRGEGEIDLAPDAARGPHVVVIVKPFRPPAGALATSGASVHLVASGRCPAGAVPDGSKTGNYLANLMALGRARSQGHHEAVLVTSDGLVAEGASSNIFIVKDGSVLTPGLEAGILAGITRGKVIEECRAAGIEVLETELTPADVKGADEAFLTSTLREVLPVVRVDDAILGDGKPGALCLRVREAYRAHVRKQIEAGSRA